MRTDPLFVTMRGLFAANLYLVWCAVIERGLTGVSLMRVLVVALVVMFATGCTTEGIMHDASDWGVEEIVELRELQSEDGRTNDRRIPTALVTIGKVSAFRPLTEKNIEEIFSEYAAFASQVDPSRDPMYTLEGFHSEVAGWTMLKVWSIPLIGLSNFEYALVPRALYEQLRFPTAGATFLAHDSGDLVAALTNPDGYFFVRKILCREGNDYKQCAKNYKWGLYDASTGEKLDHKSLTPDKSGIRIDPATFHLIEM